MYLVFTDESGTNKDSKFILYGGLCINENNLVKSEIVISDIVREYFGINSMLEYEIHFVDIFNYIYFNRLPSKIYRKRIFENEILPLLNRSNLNKASLSEFVSELFQFLNKVNAYFVFTFLDKNNFSELESFGFVFKGFLNLLDHFLNEKNENGILVADEFNSYNKKSKRINIYKDNFKFDKTSQVHKELILKRVLFESQSWKYKGDIKESFPLKYKFESKVYNIHSNVLFIPSNESMLVQISDILLYVFKRFIDFKNGKSELNSFFSKDLISTMKFVFSQKNIRISTLKNRDLLIFGDFESFENNFRQVG